MENCKMQYRIVGRFRKDSELHVVDSNPKWSYKDALVRLHELEDQANREMFQKRRIPTQVDSIGISTEYYSEYDLLDLKIQSRQVTPWSLCDGVITE